MIIAPPERKYSVWIGIHLGFTLDLPADVDQQTRIRRVWPIHRAQEVLLSFLFFCISFVPLLFIPTRQSKIVMLRNLAIFKQNGSVPRNCCISAVSSILSICCLF